MFLKHSACNTFTASEKNHNRTNVSQTIPKAATNRKKSPKGAPEAPKRLQKNLEKTIKKHPKKDYQNASQTESRNWDLYFVQITPAILLEPPKGGPTAPKQIKKNQKQH